MVNLRQMCGNVGKMVFTLHINNLTQPVGHPCKILAPSVARASKGFQRFSSICGRFLGWHVCVNENFTAEVGR